MNRVFVSYSRRNKTFTERLARDLSDAGMEVWVDWRQIHAGEFWQEEIFRGIERSEIIVVVLSPDAAKSEWVQREVFTAREQDKVIIPVMAVDAYDDLQADEKWRWILNIHFIAFEDRYEEAFPELLAALPGKRRVGVFDVVDPEKIPNPFKGLEAFQQTDSHFFFGRESLIRKSLDRLQKERPVRFLAVVGASGSGKSSLVRAGVIPQLRRGEAIPDSDQWRILIFSPGPRPVDALAQRLSPLIEDRDTEDLNDTLHESEAGIDPIIEQSLQGTPPEARLLLVVDQFEETFTRAGELERALFLRIIGRISTQPNGRGMVLITMRADFFDRLSRYPELAELFEQENMVIVTEMTPPELLRAIEGPAEAVGMEYEAGLSQRILEDVRRQPGSLPLLQYALKELFERRRGRQLTINAYESIGGVRGALAQRAEQIYRGLSPAYQALMRRVLLRLVEVSEEGEATRRQIDRNDLNFRDVPDEEVQEILDLLTSAEARLLIASREIKASSDESAPTTLIEVGHEALIREWERFDGWISENAESLRYGTELMQSANDWQQAGRDPSYLLRGNRLMRAEVWLQNSDATALQREFIEASEEAERQRRAAEEAQAERELTLQQRATNRLRAIVVVLLVSLLVAIVLSVTTVQSREQAEDALELAEDAREEAETNEQQARSFALAASAGRAAADDDSELAVMLAVLANTIEDPPPQAQRVLAEVAYAPGTVYVLDEFNGRVMDAVYSPDGSRFAVVDSESVLIYASQTGELLQSFDGGDNGHTGTIQALAYSTDGTRLVTGGDDGRVIVWDANTTAPVYAMQGHTDRVNDVAYSPSAPIIVSGGEDGAIIVWDANTGTELRRLIGHTDAVNSVAISAEGINRPASRVVSASDDGTARVWSTNQGSVLVSLQHSNLSNGGTSAAAVNVNTAIFHPSDPEIVITGSSAIAISDPANNVVSVWQSNNLDNTSPSMVLSGHGAGVTALAVVERDNLLVSGSQDDSLIQWDLRTGALINTLTGHEAGITGVALAPDSRHLISSSDDGTVRRWDLRRTEEVRRYTGHEDSDGGSVVAIYGPQEMTILSGSYDSTLRLWDVTSGLTIQQFLGHAGRVSDVDISADGTQALSASWDDTVILWDVETSAIVQQLRGHQSNIIAVEFLADDTQAISGANNGGIIRWDLATGEELMRYELPAGIKSLSVTDLDISPDERYLLAASGDAGEVVLWEVETGESQILQGHDTQVRSVAFDPLGVLAASGAGDGSLILWDVDPTSETFGQSIRNFAGHDRSIFALDFAPDSSSLISGSLDNTLRLWDIDTGFELRRYDTEFDGSSATVNNIDFSATGMTAITGMTDATIREWRIFLDLEDLLAWTFEKRFVDEPTCAQREVFNIEPSCEEGTPPPSRTPFPQPTTTPTPDIAQLSIGEQAEINTANNVILNMRETPRNGIDDNILTALQDGMVVTVVDGPRRGENNDLTWWQVETAEGIAGWVIESDPSVNVKTLVPVY